MDFFVSKVKGEKIKFLNDGKKQQFLKLLSYFEETGEMFKISVEKIKPLTTKKQRGLLQILIKTVSTFTGNTQEDISRNFSEKFYPKQSTENALGETVSVIKDFDSWTNEEFSQVLENCIEFCNSFFEMNIELESYDDHTIITNKNNS